MSIADRKLVKRFLRRGDEEAFRELYRRHTPAAYGLMIRLLGGRETQAQDLVQELWIRAVRSLPRFRWRSSLRTWLGGIAVNLVRESWRAPAEAATDVDPIDKVRPPRSERLDLSRAIARLPDGYRSVLVLRDIEGYTHEEIGRMLREVQQWLREGKAPE